ncbi:MAG: YgdI/YgdR family lipoprotein, partial [Oscillospiraceae bacterium]|nr:YgdI/YgdR family lipoprotein [Oscillospiraceae bacterium]
MKKILTAILAAVMLMCFAGCSDYVMTEDDLAKQKSIEGYWAADDSTGYNSYDENGNITQMIVVEFTEDFKYLLHTCDLQSGYVMTYDPISYSFENKNFKVIDDGVASFAKVSVSEDGKTMNWTANDKTDIYIRVTKEAAAELGIPEYDPERWNTEATSEGESGDVSESSEEDTDSGMAEVAKAMTPAVPDPEEKDYHLLDYKLDPSVKFHISGENSDFTKNPVVIAETEDGEIV